MHFTKLPLSVALSLLPLLTCSNGQVNNASTFVQGYLSFLNSSGYTSFSSALSQANQTESGQQWLSQLANGNRTVFAPTNEAFSSVPGSVSSNATLLSDYLSYHHVYGDLQNASFTNTSTGGGGGGETTTTSEMVSSTSSESSSTTSSETTSETFTASAFVVPYLVPHRLQTSDNASSNPQLFAGIYPNDTIGRTFLNSSQFVQLAGNKSQVLAWTRRGENANVTILNQVLNTSNSSSSQNITVANATRWQNLFIAEVNGVFTPPGNVSTALLAVNDTPLISFASNISVPLFNVTNGANVTNGSAIDALQSAHGFTLFAPNSDAFTSDFNATLQQLQNNQSALLTLFQNHYINGTSLYSPTLRLLALNASESNTTNTTDAGFVSAAGEPFTFSSNATGLFVSNGNNTSAQVVRPDILVNNGVIHLINQALVNQANDSSAASSAFGSATSAAAETSTDSLALGIFPTPTMTQTSSETTTTTSGESTTTATSESMTSTETTSSTETFVTDTSTSETPTPSSFRIRHSFHWY